MGRTCAASISVLPDMPLHISMGRAATSAASEHISFLPQVTTTYTLQGVISASSARNLGLRRDGHLTSVLLCAGSSGSAMFADMTSPLSPERAIFMPSMSSLPLLEMRSVVNRGILLKNVAYETKFKSSPSSSIRSS